MELIAFALGACFGVFVACLLVAVGTTDQEERAYRQGFNDALGRD